MWGGWDFMPSLSKWMMLPLVYTPQCAPIGLRITAMQGSMGASIKTNCLSFSGHMRRWVRVVQRSMTSNDRLISVKSR